MLTTCTGTCTNGITDKHSACCHAHSDRTPVKLNVWVRQQQ